MKNKDTLNRKIAPPIHEVTSLVLPTPSVSRLDNGIPVYETRLGTQDIMKIEVVFQAGRIHEHKRLVSRATSRQLREGTKTYTSAQLAEEIDFFAGTVQTPISLDTGSILMFCMTKHFAQLVPILAEIVQQPTFPQQELTTFAENNIQALAIDLTKNDVIAYRKITELIYGENHAYGYNSTPDDYRALTPDDLKKHHHGFYTADNCQIFLSGKTDETILKLVNQYFGQSKTVSIKNNNLLSILKQTPQKIKVKTADTIQAAIRIGRPFGNRTNPDFNGFTVLNTILGGFFGSRLMTNIREKKGFTYNIYSSVDMMHHDGYFYISSEVGNVFVKKAVTEIYRELEILQNDLVGNAELKMVQNYLLGNMLNMIDGPFAVSDIVRTMITEGMPLSNFADLIETIKHITPQNLRDLAQKYFNPNDMFEVIVGK